MALIRLHFIFMYCIYKHDDQAVWQSLFQVVENYWGKCVSNSTIQCQFNVWSKQKDRDHPFKTSANFSWFLTPTPYRRQFFTTIRQQIWQIFDPSPPKKCRRLKWRGKTSSLNDLSQVAPPNLCIFHRSCRGDGCIKNSKPLKPVKTSPGLLIKLYGNFLLQ